jgi:hypothetical protein
MDTKAQIQELISLGKTEEALELLAQLSTDAVLLQSRFNGAKRQYSMGLIDFSEWSRTQAQINYAALEMMNMVKDTGKGNAPGTPATEAKPKVFISYNQQDSFAMRSVKGHLEDNGVQVIVDIQNLGVGDNIQNFIEKALQENQCILSIISEHSLRSGWVNQELSSALLLRNFGKKWLPVLLDKKCFETSFFNAVMDEFDEKIKGIETEMQTALAKGRGVQAFTDDLKRARDLRHDFDETIQALKGNLGQDISGPLFEFGMEKVIKAIKG